MNGFEEQKLAMYESVLTLISGDTDITGTERYSTSNLIKLRKLADEIRRLDKELSSEAVDSNIHISHVKDELISVLYPVISALFNYAKRTNDLVLKEKTRVTQTQLHRMFDNELINLAESVRLLSLTYFIQLREFGITPVNIHYLGDKLLSFKSRLDKKVASLLASSRERMQKGLFKKADSILSSIDILAESLSDELPEFYEKYIQTRNKVKLVLQKNI